MIRGRVWLFGDDVNTDVMMPGEALYGSEEMQTRALFSTLRPGFVDLVQPGDILVAGRNFGCGSSRPASRSLVNAGIGCVVADGINSLFLRNCISYGLQAFGCVGVHAVFQEGDIAEVDCDSGRIANLRTGVALQGDRIPSHLLATMRSGGILPTLENQGLISAPWSAPPAWVP